MLVLAETFKDALMELPESEEGVKGLLKKYCKNSKDAAKQEKLFWRFLKVMEANEPSDLDEISLEEILELFEYQDTFCKMFDNEKAYTFFGKCKRSIPTLQTNKKRRVI